MADFQSPGDTRLCSQCVSSSHWPHYETMLVCRNPQVLMRTGGPRSCMAIVRAIGGTCGPDGKYWVKRVGPS